MVSDFNKKQKGRFWDKGFLWKIAGIFILGISAWFIFQDIKIYFGKKDFSVQLKSYSKQIEEIKKSNENLKERIENSDNPDYIEKVARDEINLQKPGEKVISFIETGKKENTEQKAQDSENWFASLLNEFISIFKK